jgi:hypothetical protein
VDIVYYLHLLHFTHLSLFFFLSSFSKIFKIFIFICNKKKGFPISVHLEEVEKRNVDEKVENVCCLRTGRSNNHMGDIGNGLRNRLQQVWQQR